MFTKLLAHFENLFVVLVFVLPAVIVKTLSDPKSRTFKKILISFLLATPTGVLSSFVAIEHGVAPMTASAIGVCFALISDKIFLFFVNINIDELGSRALKNIVDKWTK